MKHFLLFLAAALLAFSATSCKCSNSTRDNSDHSFYAQNMNDALGLEAEVCMEQPVMEFSIPTTYGEMELLLNDEDLWIYKGKVGETDVTFHFTIEGDKVSDGQICGYVTYDPAAQKEIPVTGLLIKENEPNPKGFNRVVFEELSSDGDVLGTFTGIVEGRGDGFNGDYKKAGEDTTTPFESMREY